MLQVLANQNSLVHNFLKELRSVKIQKDSMRFRRNLERVGEIMAYEISKTLEYNEEEINTPLGKTISKVAEKVAEKATGFKEGLMDRYNRLTNPYYGKEVTPGGHVPSEQNIAKFTPQNRMITM